MLVYNTTSAHTSVFFGIYVPAQPLQKDHFWKHLMELSDAFDTPWCLIGDFNELANHHEKRGENVYSSHHFDRLNKFLPRTNVESLQVNGRLFSWKKKMHTHLIYERLDWVKQEMISSVFILLPLKCVVVLPVWITVLSSYPRK